MKVSKYNIIFGIALVCAMVFAACDNIVSQPELHTPVENGYGRISISFAGVAEESPQMARTIFPSIVFDKYVYTFTKEGEETGVEKTPDSEGVFSMEVGSYTVEVQAFIVDEDFYTLAATGVSEQFSVAPGDNDPVEVPLSPVDSEAEGKFSYTITYPENAIAGITLEKWPSLDEIILNPENLPEENGITEMLELEAGSYLLTVIVHNDGLVTGLNEAIHIYPLLSTIYSQWMGKSYTITFNANGGTVTPESAATNTGYRLATLPTPTRSQYTFTGWYTEATGGTQVTENTVFTEDTTIYAHWTESIYTITFNANGGTVSLANASTDASYRLVALPMPTRTGYISTGWYTAATGGTRVTTNMVYTENTTIYAQWEEGITVPGDTLAEKLSWLQSNAQSGVKYLIEVNADESIGPQELSYSGRDNITVILRSGSPYTISLSSNGSLFTISSGVTFVLEDNLTLRGRNFTEHGANNTNALIFVNGGLFTMTGGTISGNTNDTFVDGGGVIVYSGSFTMSGGTISGNTARGYGGGVSVWGEGFFTMTGGTISGNTGGHGGGVGVLREGFFIMTGGTISGNMAAASFDGFFCTGGGVSVDGTFIMSGGTISGNTTDYGYGGGVSVFYGFFTKSDGGIIYGNNAANIEDRNTARGGFGGHAVGWNEDTFRTRNSTLGVNDNISTSNTWVGWGQ